MRKLLGILGIVICSLLIVAGGHRTAAQGTEEGSSGIALPEDKMILPPYPIPSNQPFLGQNHYYSVVFRGNGEGIVTLRVALSNKSETEELKEVSLRVPKVEPKDLSVYQIIAQGYCIRYGPVPMDLNYDRNYQPKCLEYSEPDYFNYYNSGKYQKAKFDYQGDTLNITLPTEIKPQKSGSFFVYFRAFGYASKNLFGAYKYNFETLKVDENINQLNLGISVDADQFLKGVKGQVEYRFAESTAALKSAPSADMGAVASPGIDKFVSQIGQGQIVKSASNLAALESYKVNGIYAGTRIKLYGKEIFVGLMVAFAIFLLVFVFIKLIFKRMTKVEGGSKKLEVDSNTNSVLILIGASFASSILIAGYTVGIYLISTSLQRVVDYQYQSVLMLIVVIVSFAVYAMLLFVPAIYIGIKRGLGWGIGSLVATVLWLVLYGAVTVAFIFIAGRNPNYPVPLPYVMNSRGVESKPAQ